MSQIKPKHQHDCRECVYITSTIGEHFIDWYVHSNKENPIMGSVIARHGSEGPEYNSWPIHIVDGDSRTSSLKDPFRIDEALMLLVAKVMLDRYRKEHL